MHHGFVRCGCVSPDVQITPILEHVTGPEENHAGSVTRRCYHSPDTAAE